MKSFLDNDASLVEDEDSWIRQVHVPRAWFDAVNSVILLQVLIDEAELANYAAPLVRQQRETNAVLVCEATENLDRIVADGEQGDSLRFEVAEYLLQLNQLRLTERSPLGTAVENYQSPPTRTSRV